MRLAVSLVGISLVLLLGCTSHEAKFERDVPPPPTTRAAPEQAAAAAAALIERQADDIAVMAPESLANLAGASALVFAVTDAPRMRSIARNAASRLLEAQLRVHGGTAFASFRRALRPDPWLTATAGLALLDVHRITKEPRFLQAAREGATAIVSPSVGWRQVAAGAAVDDPYDRAGPEIALTAMAGLFLARATKEAGLPLESKARAAFQVVGDSQPAVGHWYSTVAGKQPQSLTEWSATLLAVVSPLAEEELSGIGGAGVPGLWRAVFTPNGEPRGSPLVANDRAGLPLAMLVLQAWPDERYAAPVFARAQEAYDDEELDAYGQSEGQIGASRLALAFAYRAATALKRSESR